LLIYDPIPIKEIIEANERIANDVMRTPLVPFYMETEAKIYLKLENLHPIKSFKLRAACNAVKLIDREKLKEGIWTISAGNWAQGLAWISRKMGIKCTILVPDDIPEIKENAIKQLDAKLIKLPLEEGLKILFTREYKDMKGYFIHPFSDTNVMAGNGTIALEILKDLPKVDTILIPWGGGGLACGIASAIRALKPKTKIFAVEVDTCSPLYDSMNKGEIPLKFQHTNSYIDGIGYPFLLPEMFDLAKKLLNGSIIVSVKEITKTLRLLMRKNSIITEGAGAASVAAALYEKAGKGKIACIVSGGNIDTLKLVKILDGFEP